MFDEKPYSFPSMGGKHDLVITDADKGSQDLHRHEQNHRGMRR
jgi:hypothetical protein